MNSAMSLRCSERDGNIMAVSEKNRIKLHDGLTKTIGEEEADTLMESLPPDKWDQLVTKTDLKSVESGICNELSKLRVDTNTQITDHKNDTTRQFAELRSETSRQFAEIKSQISDHKNDTARQFAEVKDQISDHKNETAKQFAELRSETSRQFAEVNAQISELTNQVSELRGVIANQTADFKLIAVDQSRTNILWKAAFAIAVCLTIAGGFYFN